MISILLQGTLAAAPVRRTGRTGKPFATATVRAPSEEDALMVNVIAFDHDAVAMLLQLDKGDAVAVSGTAKLSTWKTADGAERTGLAVTAHRVMTAYTAIKTRRATSAHDSKPAPVGEWALVEDAL